MIPTSLDCEPLGDHFSSGCKAGKSAKPKHLAYHRGVLGPEGAKVQKRWYFWLRIQLGCIALVQIVLQVTCFLLWPGNWGEILLYGVLSKSQVFQSPHRVIPSQPAELYIVSIVAPCQGKECPDQCKKVAGWPGLDNAVLERQQKLCLGGAKSKDGPARTPARSLQCNPGVYPDWAGLLGLFTTRENQHCAMHCVHPVDDKHLEMASVVI